MIVYISSMTVYGEITTHAVSEDEAGQATSEYGIAKWQGEELCKLYYEVYNLSGTVYDATPFDGKVRTYQWEDHHSPTLVLLSEACQSMFEFLT